jgi:NTE family protein
LANGPDSAYLRQLAEHKVWNLVHLIYRAKNYEGDSKDYEFSRLSMVEHWHAGYQDTIRTLAYPEVLERAQTEHGVVIFDIAEHDHH